MAAMDGVVLGIIGAAGIGWFVSKLLMQTAKRTSQVAIDTAIASMQQDANDEPNAELKRKKLKEAAAATKRLKVKQTTLQDGGHELAKWAGVGAFGAPVVATALVVATGMTMRKRNNQKQQA